MKMTRRSFIGRMSAATMVALLGIPIVTKAAPFGQTLNVPSGALDRISVRRMLVLIKKAVAQHGESVIFKPNDTHTKDRLKEMTTKYLNALQEKGAPLYHHKIICDERNNSAADIDRGTLIMDVLLAPHRGEEYTNLRVIVQSSGVNWWNPPVGLNRGLIRPV